MIRRRFMRGEKSTDLETSRLVFRDGRWWAEWVWNEERDRQAAPRIQQAYTAFRRLIASVRSS